MPAYRTRHWRQRWDPKAELVFTRRVKAGANPKKPYVMPGDKLTKSLREQLGPMRVRRWFETGLLEIKNWKAPEPQRRSSLAAKCVNAPENEAE